MKALGRHSRLRLAIMAMAVVGLLASVLTLVPMSQASEPPTTLDGTYIAISTPVGVAQRGNGVTMLDLDVETEFLTGGIIGTATATAIGVLQRGGGFTLHLQQGLFTGTIDGKEGTAKFNATAHGVAQTGTAETGCCFEGVIQFYDGTGELEGVAAAGSLVNHPVDGRTYSVEAHFN